MYNQNSGVSIIFYKRPVKSIDELLLLLCEGKEDTAIAAKKMLQLAREGKLTLRSYKEFRQSLNMSQMQYYNVLRRLRRLGLLVKIENRYLLSKEFDSVLHSWLEKLIEMRAGAEIYENMQDR